MTIIINASRRVIAIVRAERAARAFRHTLSYIYMYYVIMYRYLRRRLEIVVILCWRFVFFFFRNNT